MKGRPPFTDWSSPLWQNMHSHTTKERRRKKKSAVRPGWKKSKLRVQCKWETADTGLPVDMIVRAHARPSLHLGSLIPKAGRVPDYVMICKSTLTEWMCLADRCTWFDGLRVPGNRKCSPHMFISACFCGNVWSRLHTGLSPCSSSVTWSSGMKPSCTFLLIDFCPADWQLLKCCKHVAKLPNSAIKSSALPRCILPIWPILQHENVKIPVLTNRSGSAHWRMIYRRAPNSATPEILLCRSLSAKLASRGKL